MNFETISDDFLSKKVIADAILFILVSFFKFLQRKNGLHQGSHLLDVDGAHTLPEHKTTITVQPKISQHNIELLMEKRQQNICFSSKIICNFFSNFQFCCQLNCLSNHVVGRKVSSQSMAMRVSCFDVMGVPRAI